MQPYQQRVVNEKDELEQPEMMKIFREVTNSDLPENLVVEFYDTGLKGGDAGHGGYTTLKFSTDNGSHSALVEYLDGTRSEIDLTEASLTIISRGDWEQTSVRQAMKRIGRSIKKVEDKWEPLAQTLGECYSLRDDLERDLTRLSAALAVASGVPAKEKTPEELAWFGRAKAKRFYLQKELADVNRQAAILKDKRKGTVKERVAAIKLDADARVRKTKAKYLAVIDKQYALIALLRRELGDEKFMVLASRVNKEFA